MRVAITGSTGMIGSALSDRLGADGHVVVPVVRHPARGGEISWDPATGRLDPADLAGVDAVVHLAGAGIGGRRWNERYRALILDSRLDGTTLLAERLAEVGDGIARRLLSASAIGVYGDRGDERLDESSPPGAGFLAEVCRRWEAATGAAEAAGVSVVHLRTGIVLSRRGGALAKMLPLFKLGLGGRFGSGRQWMSWITLDDEVSAIEHLLTSGLTGPVNLTAPAPVRNVEFADRLGTALRRPTFLPVPAFAPRLLLGRQMADALLFDGQRVVSSRLTDDGFTFAHPDLAGALRDVLGR